MSIWKIHRIAILSLALLAPGLSWAWGAEGHRLTGLIAQAMLERRRELNQSCGQVDMDNYALRALGCPIAKSACSQSHERGKIPCAIAIQ